MGADRLVEVPRLKKALEGVYGPILPKGTSPWIYIRSVPPSSPPSQLHALTRSDLGRPV